MQFGQIEREGLDGELWPLWQRNQLLDYLHLSTQQGHRRQIHWRSQNRESEYDFVATSRQRV
jgi:hypothetical protein